MTSIETFITIVLLGLGTARLSLLIVVDEITESLRDLIFHYYPPEDADATGRYYQGYRKATRSERKKLELMDVPWWQKRFQYDGNNLRKPSFIGRLLSCHKCVAVWVAAANAALLYSDYDVWLVVNTILAGAFISSATIGRYWR